MPYSVAVRERADDLGEHIGTYGLVERGAEASVGHHAQLPRKAASLDAAAIRRRIRRPSEPRGDGEVRGGSGKKRRRHAPSPGGEIRRTHLCPPVTSSP